MRGKRKLFTSGELKAIARFLNLCLMDEKKWPKDEFLCSLAKRTEERDGMTIVYTYKRKENER
jgi:hypothetical protein